jgi:hypothetical protein
LALNNAWKASLQPVIMAVIEASGAAIRLALEPDETC